MTRAGSLPVKFRATPVTDFQAFVAAERPEVPPDYELIELGGRWLAYEKRLRLTRLTDAAGREVGALVGFAYSEFHKRFLPAGDVELPLEVVDVGDLELKVLPRLGGLFVLLTSGALPPRLYMDPGGSFPMVYSPEDRRAASSPSLLLDEVAYEARFRPDLHQALIGQEGAGGWISGYLTAHRGVFRVLPNHYLDLAEWETRRFWPRPGDFRQWRSFEPAVEAAATALREFTNAACEEFDVAVTLTAGFDSRLLMASSRQALDRCEFFTIEAPDGEMDVEISGELARRYGLAHRVLTLRHATPQEMAIWDRAVGDCMMEAPRRTHPTLRELTGRNAMFTGMYGEVGRCRLYRQDYREINGARIDARFVIDRLTLPAHPEHLDSVGVWLKGLEGQPNSVIMDLAFHELKFGNWAMGQRPITNSIKLNFLPFAQRAVFEAFIGVAPAEKGTGTLFWAIIERLWPELREAPVNKYGDARDYLAIWKKVTNPYRLRRFLRDRLARKLAG